MSVITESGLYHVILNAKTDRVKPFRRWVTEEVLPQIRKTGSYSVKPDVTTPSAQQVEYHLRIVKSLSFFSKNLKLLTIHGTLLQGTLERTVSRNVQLGIS